MGHKSLLEYHLVFVTKYRKKILKDDIVKDCKNLLIERIESIKGEVISINFDMDDHVHIQLRLKPTHSISKVVQLLKSHSGYNLWQKYGVFLRKHYWYKNYFWSGGYYCSTVGAVDSHKVKRYIENQGNEI